MGIVFLLTFVNASYMCESTDQTMQIGMRNSLRGLIVVRVGGVSAVRVGGVSVVRLGGLIVVRVGGVSVIRLGGGPFCSLRGSDS